MTSHESPLSDEFSAVRTDLDAGGRSRVHRHGATRDTGPRTHSTPNARNIRLCVASNDAEFVATVVSHLAQDGVRAEGICGPEETVCDSLRRRTYDALAVLVDGNQYGFRIMDEVRRQHPRLPVIACARETSNGLVESVFAHGATAWIDGEPDDVADEVMRTLGSYLASRGPRTDGVLEQLSKREREVLAFISAGMDNLKIAAYLGVCERTVKTHVSALYRKLAQENRTQLALVGLRLGLKPPEDG